MKYPVLLVLAALSTVKSVADDAMDNLSRLAMSSQWQSLSQSAHGVRKAPAAGICEAFVVLAEGHDSSELEMLGVEIMAERKGVVIVRAMSDVMRTVAESDVAVRVTLASDGYPLLDNSRSGIGADAIHQGAFPLSAQYTGKGVVAGIYDTGVDPNHINFMDSEYRTRVRRIFRYDRSGNCTEYTTEPEIESFTTDDVYDTHGTHTLGCMAGSFNDKGGRWARYDESRDASVISGQLPNPFYGMAPEADIAIACGSLSDAAIMAGVSRIAEYAKSEGKPAVINISIGYITGAHDGTDPVTMFLDAVAEEAVVCVAAGNDGNKPVSMICDFTEDWSQTSTFIIPEKGGSFSGTLDIWSNSEMPFEAIPVIYDLTEGKIVFSYPVGSPCDVACVTTSDINEPGYVHDAFFDTAFSGNSGWVISATDNSNGNGRYQFSLNYVLNYNKNYNSNGRYRFGIIIKGSAGQRVDITDFTSDSALSSLNLEGWSDGNADLSISSMACGVNTISVGAWNTRIYVPMLNKKYGVHPGDSGYEIGEIAPYSSYGRLVDGTTRPTVCAPGTGVVSSISTPYVVAMNADTGYFSAQYTWNGRQHYWQSMDGTSMATPIVAGGIALWLEANPQLTPAEIKDIVIRTASRDACVLGDSGYRWGAGKFDALAGLEQILGISEVSLPLCDNQQKPSVTAISDGVFMIQSMSENTNIRICNSTGVCVFSNHYGERVVNLDFESLPLPKGIYLISVNGNYNFKVSKSH